MKILIVSQHYFPDPFSITTIAEYLVKKGHDVTVLTGKPNYGYYRIVPGYEHLDYEILNGVKIYRVNVIPRKGTKMSIVKNYLSFWKNAKRKVNKLDDDFDVVYSMSLSPVISISPAIKYAKKHKIKHVLHCLDLWPESVVITGITKHGTLFYNLLLMWSKKIYHSVDRILVSSPSFIEYFEDVIKIKNESICKFVPQPTLETNIIDENYFKYDKEYLNFVYCGNIGKLQNIPNLIEAIKILSSKMKIRFYIIGLGTLKDYLIKKIPEYNLDNNIIYLGAKPANEARTYFKNADALYLGLKDEGFVGKTIPNKLTFYMQNAKPIIASIGGDAKQVLLESKGAVICDNSVDGIVKAFEQFKELDEPSKEKMGINNLEYFKKHFENEIVLSKIEEELKKHCN